MLSSLRKIYLVSTDWCGKNYLVLSNNWGYEKGCIEISMPDYLPKALDHFYHPKPKHQQYAQHFWTVTVYFQRLQIYPKQEPTSLLD